MAILTLTNVRPRGGAPTDLVLDADRITDLRPRGRGKDGTGPYRRDRAAAAHQPPK